MEKSIASTPRKPFGAHLKDPAGQYQFIGFWSARDVKQWRSGEREEKHTQGLFTLGGTLIFIDRNE